MHAIDSPQALGERDAPGTSSAAGISPPPADLLLQALLSRSSLFEVWHARDLSRRCDVAWKTVRLDSRDVRQGRQRLAREAAHLARVHNRYIVRLIAADLDAHRPGLRLEWLAGGTLRTHVAEEGRLSLAEGLWIARQTAQGLQGLLEAGWVHHHLTPDHIHVGSDGSVRLLNLAHAVPDQSALLDLTASKTHAGPAAIFSTGAGDERIEHDLADLGRILAWMLTGRPEFLSLGPVGQSNVTPREITRQFRQAAAALPQEIGAIIGELVASTPFARGQGLHWLIRQLILCELQAVVA